MERCYIDSVDPNEVMDRITRDPDGALKHDHLVLGDETLLVRRVCDALKEAVRQTDVAGLNLLSLAGKGASTAEVLQALRTPPMMAPRRLVLVTRADQLKGIDALSDYLKDPVPTSTLVLQATKLDGRSKFSRLAQKHMTVVHCHPPKARDMGPFVRAEAKRLGHTLPPDAVASLSTYLGTDLSAVADALERLSLFVGAGNAITADAVDACVSGTTTQTIWDLVDAIGTDRRAQAMIALHRLLAQGEPALRVLSMIARQWRMLDRAKHALDAGAAPKEAAKQAGAPPFKAQALVRVCQNLTRSKISHGYRVIHRADGELKGCSTAPDAALMQRLVMDLHH